MEAINGFSELVVLLKSQHAQTLARIAAVERRVDHFERKVGKALDELRKGAQSTRAPLLAPVKPVVEELRWQHMGDAAWAARAGQATVRGADGSLVVLGGSTGKAVLNDVWRAGRDGRQWELVDRPRLWAARWRAAAVALPDGGLLLVGGANGEEKSLGDVWHSPDAGTTWRVAQLEAPFAARQKHQCTLLADGSVLLTGGRGAKVFFSDVWIGRQGGQVWERVLDKAPWTPRYNHQCVALPDGSVLLLGGRGSRQGLSDVWRGRGAGEKWECVTESAPWPPRENHRCVVFDDGAVLLTGGYNSELAASSHRSKGSLKGGAKPKQASFTRHWFADAWLTRDAGHTWVRLQASAPWMPRAGHSCVLLQDGGVLLAGGFLANKTRGRDVWRLQPFGGGSGRIGVRAVCAGGTVEAHVLPAAGAQAKGGGAGEAGSGDEFSGEAAAAAAEAEAEAKAPEAAEEDDAMQRQNSI